MGPSVQRRAHKLRGAAAIIKKNQDRQKWPLQRDSFMRLSDSVFLRRRPCGHPLGQLAIALVAQPD